MNWSDFLVLIIIGGFALFGLIRGLVSSLLGIISFFIAYFLNVEHDFIKSSSLARFAVIADDNAQPVPCFE